RSQFLVQSHKSRTVQHKALTPWRVFDVWVHLRMKCVTTALHLQPDCQIQSRRSRDMQATRDLFSQADGNLLRARQQNAVILYLPRAGGICSSTVPAIDHLLLFTAPGKLRGLRCRVDRYVNVL
ncbi:MAG: hypothetical protein ACK559_40225, partial [bacterium]